MFLYVKQVVNVGCEVLVGVLLLGVLAFKDRLVDMLHTIGQSRLQLVVNCVVKTFACHPYGKCEWHTRKRYPLLGQVVCVGKFTLVVKDLVANDEGGLTLGKVV